MQRTQTLTLETKTKPCQVWLYLSVIPALGGQSRKTGRSRTARVTCTHGVPKTKKFPYPQDKTSSKTKKQEPGQMPYLRKYKDVVTKHMQPRSTLYAIGEVPAN